MRAFRILLSDSKFWAALFWAAALFAFVMGVIPHPPQIPGRPSDKLQHIAAFVTLALLGTRAFPRTPRLKLLAGLAMFGGLIEIVQAIPALHRDSDVVDWLTDIAAAGAVLLLAESLRRRTSS